MLRLWRMETTGDHTVGFLALDNIWIAHTLERPWINNEKNISCIPLGEYETEYYKSPRFGETFVVKVPGRRGIIIHAGNYVSDTRGCILLGQQITYNVPYQGARRLLYSRKAVNEFLTRMELNEISRITLKVEVLNGLQTNDRVSGAV